MNKLIEEFKEFCKNIIAVDKTPNYRYGTHLKSCLNADGKAPDTGERWLTPCEMAQNWLQIGAVENIRCTHEQLDLRLKSRLLDALLKLPLPDSTLHTLLHDESVFRAHERGRIKALVAEVYKTGVDDV